MFLPSKRIILKRLHLKPSSLSLLQTPLLQNPTSTINQRSGIHPQTTYNMSSIARLPAGKRSEWKDGLMKEVALSPQDEKSPKVLVSQVNGTIYATSAKCTHYGAPLVKGVLTSEGCLTCPWHGAKFSVCTGDIEDAPGLDSLQAFKVVITDDQVFVEVEADVVKKTEFGRKPQACKASRSQEPGVVIIGGGSGGHHFIEELSRLKYDGKVTMISEEPHLPIDRTKLSKALITDPGKIALRVEGFYKELGIDVKIGTSVKKIDLEKKAVELSDGSTVPYAQLVVATGAKARTLPIDNKDLKGICTLRSIEDTKKIEPLITSQKGEKKSLVLIGSSFISMELAAFASKKENLTVHVVGMDSVPLSNILGEKIGQGLKKFHEKNGVIFHMDSGIKKYVPSQHDSSQVGAVVLNGDETLMCDCVVLGVGAQPNTELLRSAGFELEKDGSVCVDEHMRIKDSKAGNNIFAIGDIAKYPDLLTNGDLTRIEHWNVAGNHARTAAKNISRGTSSDQVSFTKPAIFWSAQGQQLRYVGTGKASQWKDVIIDGNPDEMKFVAYYHIDQEVVAIATMQRDPIMVQAAELLNQRKFPSVSEIKKGVDVMSLKL
ncbi:hypothetical protein DFH28DRAFT_1053431 [Melampsora americana]|nr:hypothetical protein DFH28DRAFT_1053431 [Melampsora americana]